MQIKSAIVFAAQIVQSLYFRNPKFQASGHHLCMYSSVCVGPGRKPPRQVSPNAAQIYKVIALTSPRETPKVT